MRPKLGSLSAQRKQLAINFERARTDIVRPEHTLDQEVGLSPGTVMNGGIDEMLAPRSITQDFVFEATRNALINHWPVAVHLRHERIRTKIPFIGQKIASFLHSRIVQDINDFWIKQDNTRL